MTSKFMIQIYTSVDLPTNLWWMAYGESMKVDFAIIKLPVVRNVARFCVSEATVPKFFSKF